MFRLAYMKEHIMGWLTACVALLCFAQTERKHLRAAHFQEPVLHLGKQQYRKIVARRGNTEKQSKTRWRSLFATY